MYRINLVLSAILTAAVMTGCVGASATKEVPTITAVSPSTAVAGSQNTKITVFAANLSIGATILVNGVPHGTTYLNKNELTSVLTSADLAQPRTLQISVSMSTLDDAQTTSSTQCQNCADFVVAPAPLKILTTSVPTAVVQAPYSATLNAQGGIAPYTWKVASGQLPSGLILAASSGMISGVPTQAGQFVFSVQVASLSSTASSLLHISSSALSTTPTPPIPDPADPDPDPDPNRTALCIGIAHSSRITSILHRYVYAYPDWFGNQRSRGWRFPGCAE